MTGASPAALSQHAVLPDLNKEAIARYRRRLIMPELGMAGQRKLKAASVLLIGAVLGYRVGLAVPRSVSRERKRMLEAYRAEVIYTDPLEGSDGAIREAHRRYKADPEKYFMPDQYSNPANWQAHYDTTGPEIIEQTRGRITHFVAGVGTSGTLMGTGRGLRRFNTAIQIVAVQPAEDLHGIEGLKHMATAIVPGIWDEDFPARHLSVRTEDAYAMA